MKFPDFQHGLRRLLPPPRRFEQRLSTVTPPDKRFGQIEWVLSRALCRFARFDLGHIPRPQRARALSLQVKPWSPFASTDSCVVWAQDSALVWVWDGDLVNAALTANKLSPHRIKIIPEPLLQARREAGLHIVACAEGFEGQAWHDRLLTHSRWWPRLPDTGEWLNFQRDAGIAPENQQTVLPPHHEKVWLDTPWGKPAGLTDIMLGSQKGEQVLLALAILALAIPTLWYAMSLIKLQNASALRATHLRALETRAGPVLAARNQTLDALNRAKALQTISAYPDQLSLMAKVGEKLPADGVYLKEWDYSNGKLKFNLTSASKLASSHYVKLFQIPGIFTNVQAAPTSDPTSLALSMDLVANSEIGFDSDNGGQEKDPKNLPKAE